MLAKCLPCKYWLNVRWLNVPDSVLTAVLFIVIIASRHNTTNVLYAYEVGERLYIR